MKFRKLRADEIECRVATISDKGCSLLLYKDARADMNLLDETVGAENWQRNHELINGCLYCNVGIKVGDSWVWKQDVGTESYTEKEKGQASDSFKRACFNWGIGRELYTAPFIWIRTGNVQLVEKNGKHTTYDKFVVKEIDYDGNNISKLVIVNQNLQTNVFTLGVDRVADADARTRVLKHLQKKDKSDIENICKYFKVSKITELSTEQCKEYLKKAEEKGNKI